MNVIHIRRLTNTIVDSSDDRGTEDNARDALHTEYLISSALNFSHLHRTCVHESQGVSTTTPQNAEVRDAPCT